MAGATLGETVDPFSHRPPGSLRATTATAVLEILFHSDLGRIGERFELGLVGSDGAGVLVGRESPGFTSGRKPPRSLADPCLSRGQMRVVWSGGDGMFHVHAEPGAKRPLRVLDRTGRERSWSGEPLAPGALVALGDRVLLQLAIRPSPIPDDLGMVGSSTEMTALRHRVGVLASLPDTVLIRGETGTGKELVARALHDAGARRDQPFIALNCASLPENLIESELFGYVKGAFSGANAARMGLFQAAGAGTLFLDEIGELPLGTQAKLLRALEGRMVRAVGAHHEEPFAARLVAATHRDLEAEVAAGRFRGDLFARLEAPSVTVPALRDRREDVPALLAAFLRARGDEHAKLTGKPVLDTPFGALFRGADAYPPKLTLQEMLALLAYDWPRNVRELGKHAADMTAALIERAPLPSPPSRAAPHDAPAPVSDASDGRASAPGAPKSETRARPTRDEVDALLDAHDFNQADVARALGVPYTTLDRWMRELGVVRPRDLRDDDIEQARRMANGDLAQMARLLRVSVRGLRSRIG